MFIKSQVQNPAQAFRRFDYDRKELQEKQTKECLQITATWEVLNAPIEVQYSYLCASLSLTRCAFRVITFAIGRRMVHGRLTVLQALDVVD